MRRTPSFEGLRPTTDAASRVGHANSSRNTSPEVLLRSALRAQGVRYRLHNSRLPGKPDLILPGRRIAIFCDGDFWHGRRWDQRRRMLARGANAPYWVAKIGANIRRDRHIKRELRNRGWIVLRVWESDVRKDREDIARRIGSLARRMTILRHKKQRSLDSSRVQKRRARLK